MTNKTDTLLDDGLFLDAASGAAPAGVRVLAACHAELNGDAADRLTTAEDAFGALLETGPQSMVSPTLFEHTLAQLGIDDEEPALSDDSAWATMPTALRSALPDFDRGTWKSRFGGINEVVLDRLCEPGVHVRLLKLPSGLSAPEHTHGGDELTLVISGSFRDEVGRYGVGDVCHAAAGHMHRPVVDSDEDCVCLAVEFGELRATNPVLALAGTVLGRLF